MKKTLLVTATALLLSLWGYAQTKGTNTLGFGVNVSTSKTESDESPGNHREIKNNNFSLSYGHFIRDNARLGIEFSYGNTNYSDNSQPKAETFGGNLSYQHYYPLIKTLYAYAGGRLGYGQTRQESHNSDVYYSKYTGNQYFAGAYGGVTWFVSKRFAFETQLLSANATYGVFEQVSGAVRLENTQTNFNLSSNGLINDLGFKIYLLF